MKVPGTLFLKVQELYGWSFQPSLLQIGQIQLLWKPQLVYRLIHKTRQYCKIDTRTRVEENE